MPRYCALCFHELPGGTAHQQLLQPASRHLCPACFVQLSPARRVGACGRSLFAYTPPLRTLVLRAKVQSDEYALRTLCELMCTHPLTAKALIGCSQVIAAPSSLWGRLRGRIDLAWFLAAAVAHCFRLPHHRAPGHLYWRLNKRAHVHGRQAVPLLFPYHADNIPTLIIDDLMTTGHTLQRVAQALSGANCYYLTLGDARTEPTRSASYSPPGA